MVWPTLYIIQSFTICALYLVAPVLVAEFVVSFINTRGLPYKDDEMC